MYLCAQASSDAVIECKVVCNVTLNWIGINWIELNKVNVQIVFDGRWLMDMLSGYTYKYYVTVANCSSLVFKKVESPK